MMNNVAFNEIRDRRQAEAPAALLRDRELLAGFWESYSDKVAEESLLSAQLVQAILQAEHREDRRDRNQTDTTDVEVTYEFISSVVNRMAA